MAAGAALVMASMLGAVPASAEEAAHRAALAAGDRVHVAGVTLVLETEIWAGVAGTRELRAGPVPATVVLRMTAEGVAVPTGLRIDGLWYINGTAVSPGVLMAEPLSAPEGEIIHHSGAVVDADGDGFVDVVIGVRDASGARHLLKAPAQPIRAF